MCEHCKRILVKNQLSRHIRRCIRLKKKVNNLNDLNIEERISLKKQTGLCMNNIKQKLNPVPNLRKINNAEKKVINE